MDQTSQSGYDYIHIFKQSVTITYLEIVAITVVDSGKDNTHEDVKKNN